MRTLLAAVVVAGMAAVSAPAAAQVQPIDEGGDYQHCATFDEFQLLHVGMPVNRVQRILDTNGHRVRTRELDALAQTFEHLYGGHVPVGKVIRQYPTCTNDPKTGGEAYVSYTHRRGKLRLQLDYLTG